MREVREAASLGITTSGVIEEDHSCVCVCMFVSGFSFGAAAMVTVQQFRCFGRWSGAIPNMINAHVVFVPHGTP